MTLDEIALKHKTDKASSHHGYCSIYASLFHRLTNPITLIEIGVQFGNSIQTWLEYFPQAVIHGIDILEEFKTNNPRFKFWLGDQRDSRFWSRFIDVVREADIIIDDGCHNADAQQITFECLWPILKHGGYYIIEDWFAIYDPHFSSPVSGREWLDTLIAALNWNGHEYHGKPTPPQPVTAFQKSIQSITLYKGLVILKKA